MSAELPTGHSQLPSAARGGHGRRVYSDEEVLELLVLLYELPHLISPEVFAARSTARTRADALADRLMEYGVDVRVNTYTDDQAGGFRWTISREGGSNGDG